LVITAKKRIVVVGYNHFEPGIIPQCELDSAASPYLAKEACVRELENAIKVARKLGVKISCPQPFSAACQHFQGMPILKAPKQLIVADRGNLIPDFLPFRHDPLHPVRRLSSPDVSVQPDLIRHS
jgi:hypothetical protein